MLLSANGLSLDLDPLWVFFLVASRLLALFILLPGIGTDQVPETFRYYIVIIIAAISAMSLPSQPMPEHLHQIVLLLASEFVIGVVLSLFPAMILGGLSVAGQVVAGVIGLGQANMIDRSLGESVSILAKYNLMFGTLVFLGINGHHVVIKAATTNVGTSILGQGFSIDRSLTLLSDCFSSSFELAIVISAPILIATLITQFLLGLITKFVPQINVFIISLPLSIFMGFYIIYFTMDPFVDHIENHFVGLEEMSGAVFLK
jgi:flagellar biosynthesis protein FliR